MTTTARGYELVPTDPAPNVPYYVNPTFGQIDADVQKVEDRAQKPKTMPNGTNWDTVVSPGHYAVDSFAASATMAGLPPSGGSGFAGDIVNFPVTTTRVVRLAIEYATSNPGKLWTSVSTVAGGVTAWEHAAAQVTLLASGDDLNTLAPGKYRAETSTIATSIKNIPLGVVNPFEVELRQVSKVNGVRFDVLTEYGDTGPIVSTRQSLSNTFQGWITANVPGSRTVFDCWGDSLTEGGGLGETWLTSEAWPARAGTVLTGVTMGNKGRSGDTTDEILIRMGVHVLYFAVTGGSIPASGAVAVTTRFKGYVPRDRNYTGTLAGVAGTLSFNFAAGTWTFTRTTAGTAVTVAGSVQFLPSLAYPKKNPLVFWAGRNDFGFAVTGLDGATVDHIIANHRKVLDHLPAGDKRVLFFGPTLTTAETVGTAGYTRVWDTINRMKYLFPGTFYSVMDYLIDRALTDAGITPTPADLTAIANREAPPSLFITGDTTHFKKAIADVIGRNFAAPLIAAKGYVN